MKILLTGKSGFIGSQIFKKVKYENSNIFSISIKGNNYIEIIKKNIKNVTHIIHCAAIAHDNKNFSEEKYEFSNMRKTIEFAKIANQMGVKQFIFFSTANIYSHNYNNNDYKLSENFKPKNILSSYANSKYKAEKELLRLSKNFKMDILILRLPLVYGEMNKGNIGSLIKLINIRFPFPLKNINNLRSFLSINNLSLFINRFLRNNYLKTGVYNISDLRPISTSEFITKIAYKLNKKVIMIKIPKILIKLSLFFLGKHFLYKKIFYSQILDISKLKNDFNFEPTMSIDDTDIS